MTRILNPDADTVFTGLIQFDAATVVVADMVGARWRGFGHDRFPIEKNEWTGRDEQPESTPGEERSPVKTTFREGPNQTETG
jgi:hypothetical protein